METTLHRSIADQLLTRPAVFADHFLRHLGVALRLSSAEWRRQLDGLRLVPDAFKIDPQGKHVTVYEVEVTHAVNEDKLARYGALAMLLNDYDWTIDLVCVDRYRDHGLPADLLATALVRGVNPGMGAAAAIRFAREVWA